MTLWYSAQHGVTAQVRRVHGGLVGVRPVLGIHSCNDTDFSCFDGVFLALQSSFAFCSSSTIAVPVTYRIDCSAERDISGCLLELEADTSL